ncbi:MAG: histidine kinase [Pseudomonadota bacterium]
MRIAVLLWALALAGCAREPLAGIGEVKVRYGNDPSWAARELDDADWETVSWARVDRRKSWWMRSSIEIPKALRASNQPLGLYLFAAASAEIHWDGQLLGRNGRPADDPQGEVPGTIAFVLPLPAPAEGLHTLAVRWSSHNAGPRVRTPVDAVFIGPYGDPLRFSRAGYLPAQVVGGSLALAFLLLIGLAVRGRDAATAWLALATLGALLQLTAETSRAFVNYPYPLHSLRLAAIGAAAGLAGLGLLGFSFRRFVPDRAAWPWLVSYCAIAGVLVLFANGGDEISLLNFALATLGGGIAAAQGIRRRRPSAEIALVAFLAFGLLLVLSQTVFLDLFFYLGLAVILLLFFVDHLRAYFRERAQREAAELKAARLELDYAKRHLQPHFLLNTLATLEELIETDAQRASRMIDALGEEFRMMSQLSRQATVSLDEEVALCRAHLDVMSLRYNVPLSLEIEDNGLDGQELRLPPVVLHTLIENALTHNRFNAGVDFLLKVGASEQGHQLEFHAPRGDNQEHVGGGLGESYITARLEEVFGGRANMVVKNTKDTWVTRLELPA